MHIKIPLRFTDAAFRGTKVCDQSVQLIPVYMFRVHRDPHSTETPPFDFQGSHHVLKQSLETLWGFDLTGIDSDSLQVQ
jgi:hypothetical protein